MLIWVCIHTGQAWKIWLATVGIEPTTFGILAQYALPTELRGQVGSRCDISELSLVPSISVYISNRPDRVAQLAEHWASIPKVVGSIPTVARPIFFKPARCGYTLRVTSQTSYSPEYTTPTQQISIIK